MYNYINLYNNLNFINFDTIQKLYYQNILILKL